jgi:ethanolamine ammonia-lyase small subunit
MTNPEATEITAAPDADQLSDALSAIRLRTPARVLAGRAGSSYRTRTLMGLRHDHAAARDAVWTEVEFDRPPFDELATKFGLFQVQTCAESKEQYLLRPDLGRRLSDVGRATIAANCPKGAQLQIGIGDGLSAAAVTAQTPKLLPLLLETAGKSGWCPGRAFFIRYCRVGVLNDIGEVLNPEVVVLLVGERPGLATAESLSAYMAYRPARGHTDAQRNLISNIHSRGVSTDEAVRRILSLAQQMRQQRTSGVAIKEQRPALNDAGPADSLP